MDQKAVLRCQDFDFVLMDIYFLALTCRALLAAGSPASGRHICLFKQISVFTGWTTFIYTLSGFVHVGELREAY